jgi:endoglucanase
MMNVRIWTLSCVAFAELLSASSVLADIQYAGVNLSGAEFGQEDLPGTFGSDYTWPTSAEITYYKSKGMNFIRLPFRWERLQHTNSAVLDLTELGRMNTFVTNATSQGMYVLLDPHNFMRYYPSPRGSYETATNGLVGDYAGSSVSNSDFANFWSQIAAVYKTNNHVFFGLNNEPDSIQQTQLVAAENLAIAAIRAAGATNLIFVPGTDYTGAWTWTNGNGKYGAANSGAMLGIVDPGNNYLFEVHQYLDYDGSGTHTNIGPTSTTADANVGWQRLTNFTAWARANNVKGFLGEFAVANSMIGTASWQIGDEALTNMLGYIQTNSDVWLGWAWWGGGP